MEKKKSTVDTQPELKNQKISSPGENIDQPVAKKKKLTIKEKLRKIPEQKPHLDFIAAILTIPLLALTLYLNISNLKNKNNVNLTPTPTPTVSKTVLPNQNGSINKQPAVTKIVITATPQPTADTTTCVKDIGPISIDSPTEGQTVSKNPVCIDINYQVGNYCSIVWSYRINNGDWSDYSNNSVCLYNLPSGNNTFDLRIKSLASESTKTLHRSFVYQPTNVTPTATVTITAPTPTP